MINRVNKGVRAGAGQRRNMRLLHRAALGAAIFGLLNFIIIPTAAHPEVAKAIGIIFISFGIACFIGIPEKSKEQK